MIDQIWRNVRDAVDFSRREEESKYIMLNQLAGTNLNLTLVASKVSRRITDPWSQTIVARLPTRVEEFPL